MNKFKVIKNTKRIEKLLALKYNATGTGLHEKVTSVEEKLTPELTKKIRYIATVRNKFVHDADFNKLPDDFFKVNNEVFKELSRKKKRLSNLIFYIVVICLFAILFYFRFRNGFT